MADIKRTSLEKSDPSLVIYGAGETTPSSLDGPAVPDPAVEKSLKRKLDLIVMPLLGIMYFTHSLDRGALGNAKTDTFEKDLGLVGNQFSLLLVLFYIPYGMFNIPATVLAKHFSPGVVIPILMFLWGSLAAISAAATNFGGILACRIVFGMVEAGLYPSAVFYLTLFYTRYEIGKRISIFYMMGFFANGFSGLIAYSVFQWDRALHGWQYLFIIEGVLTAALAIVIYILLPKSVQSSRYFTEAEKECSRLRLYSESDEEPRFSWTATLKPLLDWHMWMYGLMALCYGVGLASCANFLPSVIKRLTKDAVTANLYVLAPSLSGGVWIVFVCWLSDRFHQRALACIGSMAVSMTGYICLATVDLDNKLAVGYFLTFLLTFGSFTPAILVSAWLANNTVSTSGRATTLGLISGLQNLAGIISSLSFRVEDSPVFAPALIVSGCFQAGLIILATTGFIYYRSVNRKLDAGIIPYARNMQDRPDFRYTL